MASTIRILVYFNNQKNKDRGIANENINIYSW